MTTSRRENLCALSLLCALWSMVPGAKGAIIPVTTNCDNNTCGQVHVPFPFGLPGCGRPETFYLNCSEDELYLPLNSKQYKVLNFTYRTIIIDPHTENSCSESNYHTFNMTGLSNFWVSPRNMLSLSSCKQTAGCEQNCPFPAHVLENETVCNTNSCCYNVNYNDTSMWKNGLWNASVHDCNTFSSWVVDLQHGTEIDATYGLELGWSMPGQCSKGICANNAYCIGGRNYTGHTCRCDNGFLGDGYSNGAGCSPVILPVCNATLLVNCTCQASRKDGLCMANHSKSMGVLVGAGLAAGAAIIVFVSAVYFCFRCQTSHANVTCRRRETYELARLFSLGKNTIRFFTYKELGRATKGFVIDQKVGGGAFGTVYAGTLPDGTLIAVKAINASKTEGIEQVVNEVTVLSSVNHCNLVQLLGCCLEAKDPLLVYEFVENGTLAEHLQCERGGFLDWNTRIRIASETAGALAYLHSAISPPIYHRDVKSSNILLDAQLKTKVADFGLSRTILTEGSHISTVPQGTPGYLDPEYHQYFRLSDKSDVYSFGVVLIEIITAMKVVDFSRDRGEVNLAALALSKITSGCLDDIVDPYLEVEKNPLVHIMVHQVAELAFQCLASDKESRPTMLEVTQELALIQVASTDFVVDYNELLNEPLDSDHPDNTKLGVISPNSVHQPWSSINTSPSDSIKS